MANKKRVVLQVASLVRSSPIQSSNQYLNPKCRTRRLQILCKAALDEGNAEGVGEEQPRNWVDNKDMDNFVPNLSWNAMAFVLVKRVKGGSRFLPPSPLFPRVYYQNTLGSHFARGTNKSIPHNSSSFPMNTKD